MEQKENARAVILRERILTPQELKRLEYVTSNARSLVINQDQDIPVAMVNSLRDYPQIRKKLLPIDYNLLYHMGQEKYGGIKTPRNNVYLRKQREEELRVRREEEEKAKASLDVQVEAEQRAQWLEQSDIPPELRDQIGYI